MDNKKQNILKIINGDKNDKSNPEQKEKEVSDEKGISSQIIEKRIRQKTEDIIKNIHEKADKRKPFFDFEAGLIPLIFGFARLVSTLYLTLLEEKLAQSYTTWINRNKRWFKKLGQKSRTITTFFGEVTYWRTYYYSAKEKKWKSKKDEKGIGFYPLDNELRLTSDSFSLHVVSIAARLAAMMPFCTAVQLLQLMVGGNPSETAIEQMVLGLGAYTHEYFEQAFPPLEDGEILVIMIDGKAVPTATIGELRKRRGKRKQKAPAPSARHRGRNNRKHYWKPKKRRGKGDKSKNGRSATLVVMYTLKLSSSGELLLGPINKRVFASFAPKRYAFEYARREAEKRGFAPSSNRVIQFVSDGDKDFPLYLDEYFAEYDEHKLIETLDVIHVLEYVWKAGAAHFKEGSDELIAWVKKQKRRLLESRADLLLADLEQLLKSIPKKGPGTISKRERTEAAINYIKDNLYRMDYRYYCDCDLELSSGAVEGAVKHVIGNRLDHGGMRWIVERAEAILQLRCIMLNDQWDDFISWYHKKLQKQLEDSPSIRILRDKPVELPSIKKVA